MGRVVYWDRAGWLALAMAGLLGVAWALRETGGAGWMPGCYLRKLTGLECPGCGMTRAAVASLHGEFGRAFSLNPVGMVLLPMAMVGLGIEVLGWVRGERLPVSINPGKWGAVLILGVMVGWGVGRNLW